VTICIYVIATSSEVFPRERVLSRRQPRNLTAGVNGRAVVLKEIIQKPRNHTNCTHRVLAVEKENPFCRTNQQLEFYSNQVLGTTTRSNIISIQ
jgi:hypothetical protein